MAQRSISLRLDELRGRTVIGVAGGADKVAAIARRCAAGCCRGSSPTRRPRARSSGYDPQRQGALSVARDHAPSAPDRRRVTAARETPTGRARQLEPVRALGERPVAVGAQARVAERGTGAPTCRRGTSRWTASPATRLSPGAVGDAHALEADHRRRPRRPASRRARAVAPQPPASPSIARVAVAHLADAARRAGCCCP